MSSGRVSRMETFLQKLLFKINRYKITSTCFKSNWDCVDDHVTPEYCCAAAAAAFALRFKVNVVNVWPPKCWHLCS